MTLEQVNGLGNPIVPPGDAAALRAGAARSGGGAPEAGGKSFGDILFDAIREANRLQGSADQAIQALSEGKTSDVAGVMTAVEKADLAFRTLMEVRNKLVDAYEELMQLRI